MRLGQEAHNELQQQLGSWALLKESLMEALEKEREGRATAERQLAAEQQAREEVEGQQQATEQALQDALQTASRLKRKNVRLGSALGGTDSGCSNTCSSACFLLDSMLSHCTDRIDAPHLVPSLQVGSNVALWPQTDYFMLSRLGFLFCQS